MNDKMKTTIRMSNAMLTKVDEYCGRANSLSRNEFINEAIRYYMAYIDKNDVSEFLTPALESVISGQLADSENRIARVIFKLAVETSMLLHVVAKDYDCTEDDLDRLRGYCVDEVKRLNGKFGLREAHRYQRGE